MRFQTLPVKRRPASKGMFRRLSAVTRKQRVAATATAADLDDDDGSKVSRALIIMFLFHIVVIGLIFIHIHFLAGRPADTSEAAKTTPAETSAPATVVVPVVPSVVAGVREPVVAKAGDTYARIAAAAGVDEDALRLLNKHMEISPGAIIQLPPPRAATGPATAAIPVSTPRPVTTATRTQTSPDRDHGLVEATPVDVNGAPKARQVHSNGTREAPAHAATTPPAATGKSYVVQQGDSVWRIAHRTKVSQDALLRANGISDARKIKPGMKLVIPQKEKS